jgi:hypothetical protein
MPWISNPSDYWPSFDERINNIFPKDGYFFIGILHRGMAGRILD